MNSKNKKILMYVGGGLAVSALAYYAWLKFNEQQFDVLQSSVASGEQVSDGQKSIPPTVPEVVEKTIAKVEQAVAQGQDKVDITQEASALLSATGERKTLGNMFKAQQELTKIIEDQRVAALPAPPPPPPAPVPAPAPQPVYVAPKPAYVAPQPVYEPVSAPTPQSIETYMYTPVKTSSGDSFRGLSGFELI